MRTIRVMAVAATFFACGGAQSGKSHTSSQSAEESPLELSIERSEAKGDATPAPVISVMAKELDRSMAVLSQKAKPTTYFIGYQVTERQSARVKASRGALVSSGEHRRRTLDLDLRVGSYRLDNTRPLRGRRPSFRSRWGAYTSLPLDDNESALRSAIWLATDNAYRSAYADFIEVKANTSVKVETDDTSADFSREEQTEYYESPQILSIDRTAWEPKIKSYSSMLKRYPRGNSSSVRLTADVVNRYLVNSEGTRIQVSRAYYRLWFYISTNAADGMVLTRNESMELASLDEFPSDAEVRAKIDQVVDDLMALNKAPVADPYVGPAIIEGEAAGVLFHEIFGHRVEGHRQKDVEEGQTFAKKVGEEVMAPFIDVYDDPTIRALRGTLLNGHYQVDDEGVRSSRADLVQAGKLRGFLLSRSPTRGFDRSNGHGRRQAGLKVVARQGNLVVHPRKTVPPAELTKQLLAEVKRQGLPYGLRFTKVRGGFTTTRRRSAQAFRVMPVMVYRVYPDGREELMRGSNLEGTPLTSLTKILAASDDVEVFNGYCGAESGRVPVSATSPSILMEQVEIAKAAKEQDRPSILQPPSSSFENAPGAEVIR